MTLAWAGAVVIGLSLGLLGSGGSILTVPVLIYLVGEPDKLAIAESLAIVGLIALFGAIPYALKGQIDWPKVLVFGIPGMAGTALGAWVSKWIPAAWQLGLFALVLLLAAYMMFSARPLEAAHSRSHLRIALDGLAVGLLTGLVGVGGGFLIIPALVLLGGLPMHLAIGTSLLIIALKSASGFFQYLQLLPQWGYAVNWELVLVFAGLGVVGSLLGGRIASAVPQGTLRRAFAGFLVLMGVFILSQNIPKLFHG